jgi:ribonuclease BN (tRNA processing enzyme)
MVLVITVLLLLPSCLQADTPGMEVVVLGSGGPRAFGRAGSSFIIVLDGVPRILMDVGPGAFLRMGELGLKLEKVDRVLLSHLHIDHCGDLPAFLNDRALTAGGPISYRVFGPDSGGQFPKTSRFLDLIIGDNGAFPYQKTFGVPESFTVRDLPTNLN